MSYSRLADSVTKHEKGKVGGHSKSAVHSETSMTQVWYMAQLEDRVQTSYNQRHIINGNPGFQLVAN